jgi:hypothetical protein
MAKKIPISISGIIILLCNREKSAAGLNTRIRSVAAIPNRKIPMVNVLAPVNLMNTGIPAINTRVMAASTPTVNFPSLNNGFIFLNLQINGTIAVQQSACAKITYSARTSTLT